MKAFCLFFVAASILLGTSGVGVAKTGGVTVTSTSSQLAGALQESLESGRVFAGDLTTADTEVVLSMEPGERLASGRYRLHVPIFLAPYDHPICRDVSVRVKAGST